MIRYEPTCHPCKEGIELKRLLILAVLAIALIGMAGAANYMYEKASVKGVGYKNVEMIISTQTGFKGQKLVEKESGSGNVITERTELEAERQLKRDGRLQLAGISTRHNSWRHALANRH